MEKVLEQILTGLKALQEGQARLEKGQGTQGHELKELRQDQEAQGQRLEHLEKGQEELIGRVGSLEKGQQRLELRLEHEVIEKVKVLFDAHSLHLDYFESIRDSQARVEELLDLVFVQVTKLDDKQKNQERELRLLRAKKSQV